MNPILRLMERINFETGQRIIRKHAEEAGLARPQPPRRPSLAPLPERPNYPYLAWYEEGPDGRPGPA